MLSFFIFDPFSYQTLKQVQQMKSYISAWLATLFCLLVLGCQGETESISESGEAAKNKPVTVPKFDSVNTDRVFAYNCADSLEFTAHVTPDSTWLFFADTTVKVLPVPAGSGARYERNKYIYWSKGNEAILQKPKGSFMTCRHVPHEKSWAAAKLRGINFRATGQEPGWFVEVEDNAKTRYVGNYGEDTLHFDTPELQRNKKGDVIYNMQADNNTLHLTISDTSCTDAMSGFKHPKTVTVTINDTITYSGCGRYLN